MTQLQVRLAALLADVELFLLLLLLLDQLYKNEVLREVLYPPESPNRLRSMAITARHIGQALWSPFWVMTFLMHTSQNVCPQLSMRGA
jgi:hypothetical protein